jgi:CMP-N-acetylneuraminic acid synthetase
MIALIPARAGSKRLRDKNIRCLSGHPLLAYTISAALQSGVYLRVIVSTECEHYADIARHYGAEVPFLRPMELAGDLSPDYEWLNYTLGRLSENGDSYECFSILRPTSPFRLPQTIQRAWRIFSAETGIDSLRAVEKSNQHPGKMWVVRGKRMVPLLPLHTSAQPWHSSQYQSLPQVYVQNASLEIAWTKVIAEHGNIAGNVVAPFFTHDYEGFDVNNEYDWHYAQYLLKNKLVHLPFISQLPYLPRRRLGQCQNQPKI